MIIATYSTINFKGISNNQHLYCIRPDIKFSIRLDICQDIRYPTGHLGQYPVSDLAPEPKIKLRLKHGQRIRHTLYHIKYPRLSVRVQISIHQLYVYLSGRRYNMELKAYCHGVSTSQLNLMYKTTIYISSPPTLSYLSTILPPLAIGAKA